MNNNNCVFIYNIDDNILEKKIINQNDFSGISMHSADYYPQQNSIVIFGGFNGDSLNTMYFYKIETNQFIEIKYKKK